MSNQHVVAILDQIAGIPKGRMLTYQQVADHAGCGELIGNAAQIVASVLRKDALTPGWHRVIGKARNGMGEIRLQGDHGARQRELLEREGVEFDDKDRIYPPSAHDRPALGRRAAVHAVVLKGGSHQG